jgi:outer membrane receptor protein involved in Fe transport
VEATIRGGRPAPPALALSLASAVWLGMSHVAAAQVLDEVVVVASPLGQEDTASQGTVAAPKLQEFAAYRSGELLENVPGLIVTQHSGEGKANQYFLRGFNLDHGTDVAITVDDMPVNMRTHGHGQGYADLNFMIPELIGGIDYSKGPYFADQGDFATAGAVNIDYVDKLKHDLASVSAGTLGDYRGFAATSRPWGNGDLLAAAEYDHVDGPWKIPDNYNKGNLVLRYGAGDAQNGLSFTGMYMNDAWHATNQIPERAVQSGQINRFGALDPSDGGSSERYSFSGKYVATDDAHRIKANAYLIGYSLQLFNNFDGDVTFAAPIGDQFEQQDRRKILGGNISDTLFGTLWGRPFDNTFGFQTRTDDIHLGLAETTDRIVRFTVKDDHVIESSAGIYAENRAQLMDKLRMITGLRGDFFAGRDSSTLPGDSGSAAKGLVSPKASLISGPWQKTELYLSYGQGFHSNDFRGAVSSVNALQTELNQQAGNDTVVAQPKTPLLTKAEGYEIGVRSKIVPQLSLAAALFVLDLASEATFNGDSAGTAVGRPSRRVGVEFTSDYTPLPWLSLDGDIAFTRARFTDADDGSADVEPGHPGSYIPEAAKVVASAEMAIQNLGAWDGGLRFRYFGPRPLLEDGSVRSGPTALFDARVGYRFGDRWHVQFDIFNLFNSRAHQIDYFYASRLPNETAPVFDIHFHPVEPLSARVTLAASF